MGKVINMLHYKLMKERKKVYEKMRRSGFDINPDELLENLSEDLKLTILAKNTSDKMNNDNDGT